MTSISVLLQSLPPPSLAETDLARFCAQALGRRARAELPGLAALFGEEALRGYAPSLGAILKSLVETMVARGVEPQALDARTVDGLFGSAAFLERLEAKVVVGRQRLRPGTVVGGALRQTLGPRLLTLPGVGRELVLVAPVDLAQVPDARFSVPLGVVMARPAPVEEAEVLRASWAVIEERFGLDGPEARHWEARFIAISRRENHDAEAAVEGLTGLSLERRLELWDVLVEHLRDQELPEQHRAGRRGLERRINELGYAPAGGELPAWLEATLTLAESAYRAAGLDPEVMAGRGPALREDIDRWSGWVEVPAVARERVAKLTAEGIVAALIRLSEEEAGRIERAPDEVAEPLSRALSSLRDGCLRPRWQRSRWALCGVDPLVLARARIASGEDTGAIRGALEALAKEAAKAERAARVAEATRRSAMAVASEGVEPARAEATTAAPPASAAEQVAGEGPSAAATAERRDALEPAEPRQLGAPTPDGRGLRPSRFHLPPMPSAPPPRPAPRVRPRTDFPPMPAPPPPKAPATASPVEPRVPPARAPSTRLPSQRLPTGRAEAAPPPSAGATERVTPKAVAAAAMPQAARPPARARTGAAPHLVTPAQGNDFYDASFRELELIERDLLQRGPYGGAAERVQAIAEQATELFAALGPSARSGDREFQAAQRRIEKVQAYLERIRPLLAPRAGTPIAGRAGEPSGRDDKPGLFGRLFGKRDRGT